MHDSAVKYLEYYEGAPCIPPGKMSVVNQKRNYVREEEQLLQYTLLPQIIAPGQANSSNTIQLLWWRTDLLKLPLKCGLLSSRKLEPSMMQFERGACALSWPEYADLFCGYLELGWHQDNLCLIVSAWKWVLADSWPCFLKEWTNVGDVTD